MRCECLLLSVLAIALAAGGASAQVLDSLGDPLPEGAVQRLGTLRMRYNGVGGLAYLGDGRAVVLTGGYVDIWDMVVGDLQSHTKVSDSALVDVQVRSDGTTLLLADGAGAIREWDAVDMAEVDVLETGRGGVRSVRYSPDESRVLVGGGNPPWAQEWDLDSREKLIEIASEMAVTRCGAIYGPGGETAILGGGYDHLLEHYDLASGELLHKWGSNYEAKHLDLSPDGTCLLVGVESHAKEWQLDDYSVLHRYDAVPGEAGRCFAHDYAPLRDEAVCALRTGTIHRWNRETGEEVFSWRAHTGMITEMCVSPDGRWALSYGVGLIGETSMDTGESRAPWDRHSGPVESVAFTPSGERVVSGSADATLRVWDVATGETDLVISGATLGAYALAVSPDGSEVAAGCKDGIARVFDLASGELLRELIGHLGYVRSVAYTHDGERLLSSADDGSVRLWARDSGEPVAVLEGHRGGVLSVAISPDDSLAVTGGRDGTVRIWDLAEGALVKTLEGHRGWVEAVAFSDGEHAVVSSGRDGRVIEWDVATGEMVREMAVGGWVYGLAISPDGARVYAVGTSCGVACVDLATGEEIAEFTGHQKATAAVAVSPDGRLLVTGSRDNTLLVWEAPEL